MKNTVYKLAQYKNVVRISHKGVRCYAESVKYGSFGVKSLFHKLDELFNIYPVIPQNK